MLRDCLQKYSVLYTNLTAGITIHSGYLQGSIPVAIKEQIHGSLDDANASISEAMIQAQLDHPNICKVYGCFLERADGANMKTVIVVELLDGDLMKQIRERSVTQDYWSEADLIWTLSSLSVALSFAQSKGVAHRDIKPQNIFISPQKQVKLGDFGSSVLHLTPNAMDVSLQGTPFFLSPELKFKLAESVQGKEATQSYDPYMSDVYSLGVTMLYMGSLLPPTSLMNASDSRTTEEVLQSLGSYERLKSIIHRMLAYDPAARPSFYEIEQLCSQFFYPLANASLSSNEVFVIVAPEVVQRFRQEEANLAREKCCVCREEVKGEEWHLQGTGKFPYLRNIFSSFCGLLCVEKYARGCHSDLSHVCVRCNSSISLAMLQSSDSLLLPCAHGFHTPCFRDYLNETYSEVICPACNIAIPTDLIDTYTKSGHAKELCSTKELVYCSVCHINPNFTSYGGCGHNVCSDCDFGFFRQLFSIKCRVCYELSKVGKS